MTLREQLKETIAELDQAGINSAVARRTADLVKIRKERKLIENRLDNMRIAFITQIESGKVPYVKVTDYAQQKWFKSAASISSVEHQDLWDKFKQFWTIEGLAIDLADGHDGQGLDSWLTITIKIPNAKTR